MKKKFKRFVRNFWLVLNRREMLILPGNLAFFFLMSIVPILTLLSFGAGFFNLSISFINEFITSSFGSGISEMITPLAKMDGITLSSLITLFVGYFIASNGAGAIITTSNMIYGIKDKGYIYRKIKALVMTIFIIILFLFILVFPLFGNKVLEVISYLNLNENISSNIVLLFNILKGPFAWLVIFIFIKIIYTMAPDRGIASNNVNYGAFFTSIGWILITWIYSYYINNYAHYSVYYGGLANLVILLMWFYFLAYVFVIGMALNYREEKNKLMETTRIKIVNVDEMEKNG